MEHKSLKYAEPDGVLVTPYGIIVLLGNTNTAPPANGPYCPYTIV
jgi:hypothetical protein